MPWPGAQVHPAQHARQIRLSHGLELTDDLLLAPAVGRQADGLLLRVYLPAHGSCEDVVRRSLQDLRCTDLGGYAHHRQGDDKDQQRSLRSEAAHQSFEGGPEVLGLFARADQPGRSYVLLAPSSSTRSYRSKATAGPCLARPTLAHAASSAVSRE
jgi:hypothetical protein